MDLEIWLKEGEPLLCKYKALSSNPSPPPKKPQNNKKQMIYYSPRCFQLIAQKSKELAKLILTLPT
jgi:hypothetical protein